MAMGFLIIKNGDDRLTFLLTSWSGKLETVRYLCVWPQSSPHSTFRPGDDEDNYLV